MILTLRIRQDEGLPAGQTSERRLEHGRLVIGRGAESDWVLADPGRTISKRHCVIEQAELGYELTDLSINGVFLNDEDEPVGVGNTRRLRHGDRIRIGPYRLAVELSGCDRSASPEPTSLGLAARLRQPDRTVPRRLRACSASAASHSPRARRPR